MAGTPEEDLLGWLEREEERLGFADIEDALGDIAKARDLFYDELGYDITDDQFQGLKDALVTRYEDFPTAGVKTTRDEHSWGYQTTYRIKGRFASFTQVQEAIRTPKE
tara:strand:+ start:4483 stop:4806 length:324 start_codon:yes stop_codon:yes gene_type:complete